MKVICFALGTWGDFFPMYQLAVAFGQKHPSHTIAVVTHAELQKQFLQAGQQESESLPNVSCCWLPIPMHFVVQDEQQQLQEFKLLQACCQNPTAGCIVFNLYSIVAYHLAEWLAVPCLAFHAGANPPENPVFMSRLRRRFPLLYARLCASEAPCVTIDEVNHWLSAVWSGVYTSWRRSTLGLPPAPLSSISLPPSVPLIYALSPTLLQPPGYWPASIHVVGHFQPSISQPASPSQQIELEAFFDQCAKAGQKRSPVYFGFGSMKPWEMPTTNPNEFAAPSNKRKPSPEPGIEQKQDRDGAADLHRSLSVFETLQEALEMLEVPGIFHNIPCSAEIQSGLNRLSKPHILELSGFVNLAWLLPQCSVAVHHGGAGTVTQAVVAQVPQVICPIEFDQQFWGRRVEALGLGAVSTLHSPASSVSELVAAISRARGCAIQAQSVGEIVKEQGLARGVDILTDLIQREDFHHHRKYRFD